MYHKDFYISEPVGNNAFSYWERPHKQLFVPSLKQIENFDDIKLLNPPLFDNSSVPLNKGEWAERKGDYEKVTFEEYDFDENMQTCFGLENFYKLNYHPIRSSTTFPSREGKGITSLYLVDNHNHVFYFWYLARSQGIISDNALLYHIDEHADTRDPWEYLLKPDSHDLQKVFDYTNFTLNVGNYIIPAEREWLIWETIQIRGEEALQNYMVKSRGAPCGYPGPQSIILNLDLDFFEPELDFIDYDLKKQVILDVAQKADLITVCTSPYFIDQERALKVFRDIFDSL